MDRIQLTSVHQEARQHHGAGDRNDRACRNTLDGGPSVQLANPQPHEDGEDDPDWCSQEGNPLHLEKLLGRELDPNGIHEKDDSDFGEKLQEVDFGDGWAWCKRSNHDAAKYVSENERLTEPFGNEPAAYCDPKNVGQVAINCGSFHSSSIAVRDRCAFSLRITSLNRAKGSHTCFLRPKRIGVRIPGGQP